MISKHAQYVKTYLNRHNAKYKMSVDTTQQAKDIGPIRATNGYLYGSYMGNP